MQVRTRKFEFGRALRVRVVCPLNGQWSVSLVFSSLSFSHNFGLFSKHYNHSSREKKIHPIIMIVGKVFVISLIIAVSLLFLIASPVSGALRGNAGWGSGGRDGSDGNDSDGSDGVEGGGAVTTVIRGVCMNRDPPTEATVGNSCGIPDFADVNVFGDNMDTTGVMRATPIIDDDGGGLHLRISLANLPKPDLVLTAWIIWVPGGVTEPEIFEVANHAIPAAPTTAGYTSGFGVDPNEFQYTSSKRAVLDVRLNFNPTYPGQGPLTRENFCFQKDVVGIKKTDLRQYETSTLR